MTVGRTDDERERDARLVRAYEAGAYSQAYENRDGATPVADAMAGLGRDAEYAAAFTLGYYAVHERHEVPAVDAAAYDRAAATEVALRLQELGVYDRCFLFDVAGGLGVAP